MSKVWTAERSDELCDLIATGRSASQIAATMGEGLTRSAIIGRVHRMGIALARTPPQKTNGAKPPKKRKPPPQTPGQRAEMQAAAEIADSDIPLAQRRKLVELRKGECHYPIGDPKHADFFFCAGPQLKGQPYCAYHCQLSYNLTPPYRA